MINLPITLNHPPVSLHPNKKVNPYTRTQLTRRARGHAKIMGLVALDRRPPPRWHKTRIEVIWTFRQRRPRDEYNLAQWLKAYVDGLKDANIILDDSMDNIEWTRHRILINPKVKSEVTFVVWPLDPAHNPAACPHCGHIPTQP